MTVCRCCPSVDYLRLLAMVVCLFSDQPNVSRSSPFFWLPNLLSSHCHRPSSVVGCWTFLPAVSASWPCPSVQPWIYAPHGYGHHPFHFLLLRQKQLFHLQHMDIALHHLCVLVNRSQKSNFERLELHETFMTFIKILSVESHLF